MSGFGVEPVTTYQVVAAWTIASQEVTSEEWESLGQFWLPSNVDAKLDVVGMLSASGLTMTVDIWDATNKTALVPLTFTEQAPIRKLSSSVALTGQRMYMIRAKVAGSTGADEFGTLLSAGISD